MHTAALARALGERERERERKRETLPRQASQVPSASDSAVSSFVQKGMLVQTQVRRSHMCLMAVAVTLYLHTHPVTSPYVCVTV